MADGVGIRRLIAGFFAGFAGDGQVVWGREQLEVPITQQQAAEAGATLGRA